jgi:simple sugar transport system ATP-binding protein
MKVELRDIHKSFGPVHANDGITLDIPAGTIQGLLGENGAGKSTLMKSLSGFMEPDSGQILLDGKPVSMKSPADAIAHGVGMLHQDPLDFPPMRVIDNFLIGGDPSLLPKRGKARRALRELGNQFGFSLDPNAYVDTLTVGERQQLEILRLLWLGVRAMILDEPTTGISAPQREKLFKTLKRLAEEGRTIIFVSHKLEEVEDLCHRVAVLREGRLVGEAEAPYTTSKLVGMMFGKEVALIPRTPSYGETPVLQLQGVSIEDPRLSIEDVNLDVREGEVIGLAGMEGSGQRLFLQTCAGLVRPVAGRILLDGDDMAGRHYHDFKSKGCAFMPASRLEEGLIPGMTLTEHFILTRPAKGLFVNWEKGRASAREGIAEFSVRGEPYSTVESLSGGNQQRALLALLTSNLRLLLMEQPTRGLDMESAIFTWEKLKERCQEGTAVVFVSSDLEELLHYSDRVLVFFAGKVSQPLESRDVSVERLGELIGGIGLDQPNGAHDE